VDGERVGVHWCAVTILGISGVEGTVAFKREHWPGRDEREYRISQGHDSAAALVVDGVCVAAVAEERMSRRKHTGDFPGGAVEACLAIAGIRLADVDEIVHSFDYAPHRLLYSLDPISRELYRDVLSREAFARVVRRHLPDADPARIGHVDHHLAHAASAAFTSGWDECLVVVIDGMGEAHGATAYHARDGELRPLLRIPASDSIGIFYSLITLHLGFDFNADEYKIMGLAPYGDRSRFAGFFADAVCLTAGGGWEIPSLRENRTREEREFYTGTRRLLTERLIPARAPEDSIERIHEDVAAGLQDCLDRVILHICGEQARALGVRRLALAGGVALNTTANARLRQSGLFDEIYVQPAAADDGSSLGAALARAAAKGQIVNRRFPAPFLGPGHTSGEIREALDRFADRIEVTVLPSLEATCEAAAGCIAAGEVVAWYRGRMEFGPRALGARSILADPSGPDMRDRVNRMVKQREAFRPFAPAVSLEQVDRWFDVPPGTELPYMVVNVQVRDGHRAELPAVTHVDGSARVQTVSDADNLEFRALLGAVGRRTGRELVLNTSFNVKGQPIVNTPSEAVETFLATGIDALFLDDALVRKR
jgi:carbamoyltransferase